MVFEEEVRFGGTIRTPIPGMACPCVVSIPAFKPMLRYGSAREFPIPQRESDRKRRAR